MKASEVLDSIEQLIISGSSERAAKQLLKAGRTIEFRSLHPEIRARWAQLLRRAGNPKEAIRLLHSFVRGQHSEITPPDSDELLEYGAALSFFGLEDEAATLLASVRTNSPMRDLYLAFALFPQWRYREAEAPLQSFLKFASSEQSYFKSVAEVNLGAVKVFAGEYEEAERLLVKTAAHAFKSGYRLLCGNAWELLAQVALHSRKFSEAESRLNESQRHLSGVHSIDALFVTKWKALLQLERAPNDPQTLAQLNSVENLARARNHYETIRDITLRRVVRLQDRSHAKFLVTGTPYSGFFQRPDGAVALDLAAHSDDQVVRFNRGKITENSRVPIAETFTPDLPAEGLELQTMRVLFSDFYKPFSIQRLWQETSLGQFFNPASSPNLIHQKLHRTRRWLQRANSSLAIHCHGSRYEIYPERPVELALPLKAPATPINMLLAIMRRKTRWSLRDLLVASGLSRRTLQRQLNLGVMTGVLRKSGRGRATFYLVT